MTEHSSERENEKTIEHKIQLQLTDSFGFLVPKTQFWITVTIQKEGEKILLQLPTINFQTTAAPSPSNPFGSVLIPGGFLQTVDGFLPEFSRPSDIVYRSIVGASNNGASLAFSFLQPPAFLPTPPVGYIVQITNFGGIIIQCAGTFGNVIPPGPQILLPSDISYLRKPTLKLDKNYTISAGASNITQFSLPQSNDGIRDSHVNDAFDNILTWAWTDNSNISDKTNGVLNLMVAIGKVGKNGKLKVRPPIQLTNLLPGQMVWDTAVAINRTNKKNIVVSWGLLDYVANQFPTYRAVSFDGGKTFLYNGITNIQPTGGEGFGDDRGVSADKFGNFWYSITNFSTDSGIRITQPAFWISTNGGITFSVAYTAPLPIDLGVDFYDYPQYCFGGDGLGNYGLWFVSDYFTAVDIIPVVGFIPITGPGQFGTGTTIFLYGLNNTQALSSITASEGGRVWTNSNTNLGTAIDIFNTPACVRFKSPGPLDSNYAGPWDIGMVNFSFAFGLANEISYPFIGYFNISVQTNIYDENRQALYSLITTPSPTSSQNIRLYFIISRDNGQTWSNPIDISTTNFANRGYASMALDAKTGNLVFGWYDGRNDPTYKSIEYFGAVIPANVLNELVKKIPLSNPLYTLPPATTPIVPPTDSILAVANEKMLNFRKKIIDLRKRQKLRQLKLKKISSSY